MPDHEQLKALLRDRKQSTKGRATRRMSICLDASLSMDLALAEQELTLAEAAVEEAKAEASLDRRQGGTVPIDPALTARVKAAEKAVQTAEVAADPATVIVTFTALKASDYDRLVKEHPPRDDNERDQNEGVNVNEFLDALVLKSASKVEDADGNLVDIPFADLFDELSKGERDIAHGAATEVNQRTLSVPFSDANSRSRQRSGSKSKRR